MKLETEIFIIGLFRKTWICEVFSSGFHNGARCTPDDPHGKPWRCHFRYTSSLSEAFFAEVQSIIKQDSQASQDEQAKSD